MILFIHKEKAHLMVPPIYRHEYHITHAVRHKTQLRKKASGTSDDLDSKRRFREVHQSHLEIFRFDPEKAAQVASLSFMRIYSTNFAADNLMI